MNKKQRKERKAKARRERIRQEKHLRHSVPVDYFSDPDLFDDDDELLDDDFDDNGIRIEIRLHNLQSERMHRRMDVEIRKRGICTNAELQELMAELNEGRLRVWPESAEDRAQELAYCAMEATDPAKMRKLAKEALLLDPNCTDATVLLIRLDAVNLTEAIAQLVRAVESAELLFGKEFIDKSRGRFWGITTTRPYMRALSSLATAYYEAQLIDQSIATYEKILNLNPEDNQGARDQLLRCYLVKKDTRSAAKLLRQYSNGGSASFAWGQVLFQLLLGKIAAAKMALREALATNSSVLPFLTGARRLPTEPQESYVLGEISEAIHCAMIQRDAWNCHPHAKEWLLTQEIALGAR